MKITLKFFTDKILTLVILLFNSILYSQISYSNIELNNSSFENELISFVDEIDTKHQKLFKQEKVIIVSIKKNEINSDLDVKVIYGLISNLSKQKNFRGVLNFNYKGAIVMLFSEESCISNFFNEIHPVKFSEKVLVGGSKLYTINGLEIKYVPSTFPSFDNSYVYEFIGGIYKFKSKK